MSVKRPVYPFSALVGQERLKQALILCAINPRIGGVLIRGEKGTAKSTAVRGLAALLPPIPVVTGCPYSCAPDRPAQMCAICLERQSADEPLPTVMRSTRLVELPVAASEDRVVGALDLEHAISEGQRRFEPGLLAQVNRGLLYVDEVNLLDDHLVDLLLDAAAMGINTVEREGISVSHPARFMLVGTMNPEEGELRPQLLDRFGLAVEIAGLSNVADRIAVIERRMAYDADAAHFATQWQAAEEHIAERVVTAQALLPSVRIQTRDMAVVAGLALQLGVDGHRADLTILETARTHAAWSGRTSLTDEDIQLAAELALPHRLRRQPFADVHVDSQTIADAIEQSRKTTDDTEQQSSQSSGSGEVKKNSPVEIEVSGNLFQDDTGAGSGGEGASMTGHAGGSGDNAPDRHANDIIHVVDEMFRSRPLDNSNDWKMQRRAAGRRSRSRTRRKQGRYITSERVPRVTDLALDATIREAAPYQQQRRALRNQQSQEANGLIAPQPRNLRLILYRDDLRQKVRVRRTRNAVCFVVDASWSMAAEERMSAAKAAVLSLLRDAYQRRDRVGLVSFQRNYAHILLPLTNSVELAQRYLEVMPTGGKTPLALGLLRGFEVLHRARRQDSEIIPLLVVITDGQANVAMSKMPPQIEAYQVAGYIASQEMRAVVIDTENHNFDRGLTRQIANHIQGEYVHLNDLKDGGLVHMIQAQMGSYS